MVGGGGRLLYRPRPSRLVGSGPVDATVAARLPRVGGRAGTGSRLLAESGRPDIGSHARTRPPRRGPGGLPRGGGSPRWTIGIAALVGDHRRHADPRPPPRRGFANHPPGMTWLAAGRGGGACPGVLRATTRRDRAGQPYGVRRPLAGSPPELWRQPRVIQAM